MPLAGIGPKLGFALGLALGVGVVLAIALPLRALGRRQKRNKHSWSSRRPLLAMFTRPRDTYRWLVKERPGLYVVAIGLMARSNSRPSAASPGKCGRSCDVNAPRPSSRSPIACNGLLPSKYRLAKWPHGL